MNQEQNKPKYFEIETANQLDRIENQNQMIIDRLDKLLERKKPKKALLREWIEPQYVSPEVWKDYLKHRREKRQTMKETAYKRILKQFSRWHDQGHDLDDILLRSIANGWTGVFPPPTQITKQTNGASVEHVQDSALEDWAKRNGAPPPKQQADYNYDRYRADLMEWERMK